MVQGPGTILLIGLRGGEGFRAVKLKKSSGHQTVQ